VFASFVRSVTRAESYRGIPIQEEIPTRRLVAFDLAALRWGVDSREPIGDDWHRRIAA
jgi:hypothetical protein